MKKRFRPIFEEIPKDKLKALMRRGRVNLVWLTNMMRKRGVSIGDHTVRGWLAPADGSRKCFYGHIELMTEILEARVKEYESRPTMPALYIQQAREPLPIPKVMFLIKYVRDRGVSIAQLAARAGITESKIYNWRHGKLFTAGPGELSSFFAAVKQLCPDAEKEWETIARQSPVEA